MNGPTATAVSRLERTPPCPFSRSKAGSKKVDSRIDRDEGENGDGDEDRFDLPYPATRRAAGSLKDKGKEGHVSWEVDGSEEEDSHDEDDEEEEGQGQVTVHDGVKLRDVTGVKVWQKEMWDLRL